MSLAPGTRIAAYEIVSLIGAGGMGEVYRARDSRLGRDVALKALPDSFRNDPERTARFAREAHVLASLNHPNIAQIYGFEEGASQSALVMEFVDGETLAERLRRGPIAVAEAVPIARQILAALESAHAHGIVHRDLKPANIKLSESGALKVLDFGLAKAVDDPVSAQASASLVGNSPTITSPVKTMHGVVLGTAAYMAPEQAKGRPVDRRADMWAFGCVLFEMLSGRMAFGGEDVAETIAAVLTRQPDWSLLPGDVPGAIRSLLQRCCERNVQLRIPDATVARWLLDEPSIGPLVSPLRTRIAVALFAAAAIAVIGVGFSGRRAGGSDSAAEPLRRLSVGVGADVSLLPVTNVGGVSRGVGSSIALSPDGQRLAFVGREGSGPSRLFVRSLSELVAQPVSGTDDAAAPFFSPRGDWLAFFAGGKLKKVPVTGGVPTTLCDVPAGRGGTWTDDDIIVFTPSPNPGSSLMRVSASGGMPQQLTQLAAGQAVHRWPQALPAGAGIMFTISSSNTGPYDFADLAVVPLDGGSPKIVLNGGSHGRYVDSGHLLYLNRGTLHAVPFDLATLSTTGDSVPVVEQVSYANDNGAAQFAVSNSGTLAYITGVVGGGERNMSWIDRSGISRPLGIRALIWNSMRFSPDGRSLLINAGLFQGAKGVNELWILDWDRDALRRLTFSSGDNLYGEWSPDGTSVLFVSNRAADHVRNIYWQRSDGSSEAVQVTSSVDSKGQLSMHQTGKFLAFASSRLETALDISVMPIESTGSGLRAGPPVPFVNTAANENLPSFSPDGRWLAYVSDETGRSEVYVRPFPGPGGKWQVSASGGSSPQWSRNQPELLFQAPDRNLMVSRYTASGAAFDPGKPQQWADKPIVVSSRGFALHPDGKRIAVEMLVETPDRQIRDVTLVTTFLKELRRVAPPK